MQSISNTDISLVKQMLEFWQFTEEEMSDSQPEMYWSDKEKELGDAIIHEAADVRSATVDVIRPVRQRVLDYKDNPWHVIQWSGATPSNGMVNELVIVDDPEKLERIRPDGLSGKIVLTRLNPRGRLRDLARTGAAGVITDEPVGNLPNATPWTKFGWGGIPIGNAAFHLVGLVLSENAGKKLRRLAQKHGRLTLRTRIDTRKYLGTHDIVSGLIPGQDRPQEEIWALAHNGEPGAIDNSSANGISAPLRAAR